MSNLVVSNPIVGIAALVLAFSADYYQTLRAARIYSAGVQDTISFEGSYELNPAFVDDIDQLRRFSPRFVIVLLAYIVFVLSIWFIAVRLFDLPQLYAFALGAVLLIQSPVQIRHARNVFVFQRARDQDGISGHINYTRRFSYRASAVEFVAFSALYLILALLASSWLLAGGAFGCAVLALSHFRLLRRQAGNGAE